MSPRATAVAALSLTVLAACGGGGGSDGGGGSPVPPPPTGPAPVPPPTGSVGFLRGWALAYVTTSPAGVPTAVGLRMSEAVLETSGLGATSVVVPIPATAGLPFDHVQLDWNPAGHPPAGVYHHPHYDIHFFMITQAERDAIRTTEPGPMFQAVPAAMVPPGYRADTEPFDRMGIHWLDATAPEFQGQGFTRTYIQGFHAGRMIFQEPMVTKAFLETRPDVSLPIAQPATYPRPGRYPTTWRIRYDASAKEYVIALENLVLR
jgi:hypothetical protein